MCYMMWICLLYSWLAAAILWVSNSRACHTSVAHNNYYCQVLGVLKSDYPQHLCTLDCLGSSQCLAINYNTSSQDCMLLPGLCAQLTAEDGMIFSFVTDHSVDGCLLWENLSGGYRPMRSLLFHPEHSNLPVVRFTSGGVTLFGYGSWQYSFAVPASGVHEIEVDIASADALTVHASCTTVWMPYKAKDPLPAGAFIGGHMDGRGDMYVIRFEIYDNQPLFIAGYYIEGEDFGYAPYVGAQTSSAMDIVVVV